MPAAEAAAVGDLFVTATGDVDVIRREHFERMRDGAVVANAGHFNVELDLSGLAELADGPPREVRPFVQEYRLSGGRRIYLLAEGRLVNLAAAEGHPASVMDIIFANQALGVRFIAEEGRSLQNRVYAVPKHLDDEIARLKLQALGVDIDELTDEQRRYLASWERGT
jgi:adenosylhomocysteinase